MYDNRLEKPYTLNWIQHLPIDDLVGITQISEKNDIAYL